MSQENNEVTIEAVQKELEGKNAALEDMQKQFDAVKAKADQLLDETKKAKNKAREEADIATQAQNDKAKKNGDYEQLLQSSEKERQALSEQLTTLNTRVSTERVRAESMKLAAELADGANAELLSEFVSKRLRYTDDGLKVLDKNGELTVSSVDDLKREFEASDKYVSLLRGNKSNGGGATGDGGGAAKAGTIPRSQFDKMNPKVKMDYIKKGGTLTDD